MDLRLVYITAKDREEATMLAQALLRERLAACINMHDVESLYRWKGKIEKSGEVVLTAKTTAAAVPKLIKRVEELHSHECPCILTMKVEQASQNYTEWVCRESLPDTGK